MYPLSIVVKNITFFKTSHQLKNCFRIIYVYLAKWKKYLQFFLLFLDYNLFIFIGNVIFWLFIIINISIFYLLGFRFSFVSYNLFKYFISMKFNLDQKGLVYVYT